MLFRKVIFTTVGAILAFSYSNAQERRDFTFFAMGISKAIDYNEAEVEAKIKMFENAKSKCDSLDGPVQVSQITYQETSHYALYAWAQFKCSFFPLDRKKCWYPDDSNPNCFLK